MEFILLEQIFKGITYLQFLIQSFISTAEVGKNCKSAQSLCISLSQRVKLANEPRYFRRNYKQNLFLIKENILGGILSLLYQFYFQ